MRVPDPAPARMLIWGAIGCAALAFATPTAAPPELAVVRADDGCVLAPAADGLPCVCADWPARLRLLAGLRVPLGTASARELEAVPGFGPSRAQAVVAERGARPFERLDALVRVRGIGPGTVERVRPFLSAEPVDCAGAEWS